MIQYQPEILRFYALSRVSKPNFLPQNISRTEFELFQDLQPKVLQYVFISADELLAQVKTKKAFNPPVVNAIPLVKKESMNFIPYNLGEISLVVELPDGNFTVLVYEVR